MWFLNYIPNILMLLAGLGAFLFGLKAMGDNLESVAGSKLRKLFNKISNNRFSGIGIGAAVTAVIQSSSATTVMVVGFVNAGVMSLMQAASIIMGANIGTTITAQLMQLKALNLTAWLAATACVGAFMTMSKKDTVKKIGSILAGLGLIFIGLDVMGDSVEFFAESETFKNLLITTSNPFLLLLIGAVFTAVVQSSSATTGILIVLVGTGVGMPLSNAIFITLGINIGTCITAALAAIGTNKNAQRAATIHLLFNVIGAILFLILCLTLPIDEWLIKLFGRPETQLAMFHTFFNVITTILLVPFVNILVKISTFLIRDKKGALREENFVPDKLHYVDERILNTPAIAITQLQKEILLMADIARKNLDLSIESILNVDLSKKDKFEKREKHLNFMNRSISDFLVKLSATDLSFKDELKVASYYHVVSDLERVGDYAENIMEYAAELSGLSANFSEDAKKEISDMYEDIKLVYSNMLTTFTNRDMEALEITKFYEDKVDVAKKIAGVNHIKRLNANKCPPEVGALFLSLISNMERISDHMQNVAISIKDYTRAPKKVQANVVKK